MFQGFLASNNKICKKKKKKKKSPEYSPDLDILRASNSK